MNLTYVKDLDAIDGIAQVHTVKRTQGGVRELFCSSCAEYIPKSFPTQIDGTGKQCELCDAELGEGLR